MYMPQLFMLSRLTLAENFYFSARVDAPNLSEAMLLTNRAKSLISSSCLSRNEKIYYDYVDPGSPGGDEWVILKQAVLGIEDHLGLLDQSGDIHGNLSNQKPSQLKTQHSDLVIIGS